MFIDRSEFSAHNQVIAFQNTVVDEKKKTLETLKKTEVLNAFTLDSPIPFDIKNVLAELKHLNEEKVQGSVRFQMSVNAIIEESGVRSSWLITARKLD